MRELGAQMGEACDQSSETFHDNFAYEDGERRQYMWGEELRKLTHMRDGADLVDPPRGAEVVRLGTRVTVQDGEGRRTTFVVGSYATFGAGDEIVSYHAPLARIVVGAEVGEVCEGVIRGRLVELEVLAIELSTGCQVCPAGSVLEA